MLSEAQRRALERFGEKDEVMPYILFGGPKHKHVRFVTYEVLVRRGYIKQIKRNDGIAYLLTPAGRAALQENNHEN